MHKNQKGFSHVLIVLLVVLAAVIGLAGWRVYSSSTSKNTSTSGNDVAKNGSFKEISTFEECVAAGNVVRDSYPEQCTADGKQFTNTKTDDKILKQNEALIKQAEEYVNAQPVEFTGSYLTYNKLGIRLKLTKNTQDFYFSTEGADESENNEFVYLALKKPEYTWEWQVAAITQYVKGEQVTDALGAPLGKVEDIYNEWSADPGRYSTSYQKRGDNYYWLSFGNGGSGCSSSEGLLDIECYKEYLLFQKDVNAMFKEIEQL